MGMNFPLGFYQEALRNTIDPDLNLKLSSHYLQASSPMHELGVRGNWDGKANDGKIAFRCYEEVEP